MSYASSTLFYGVFVKTVDLCIAAKAWQSVNPVFQAISLVELRRNQGTLRFAEDGAFNAGALPTELWIKVKDEVTAMECIDAEDDLVRSFHPPLPPWSGDHEASDAYRKQQRMLAGKVKLSHLYECQQCMDDFVSDAGMKGLLHELEKVYAARTSA
ncbi:hypothetical protein JCM11251_004109 [Rhodosporidiobolus azoricus]